MKSYVITIKDLPKSVDIAQRCINSVKGHNVQMFEAFTPKNKPEALLESEGLPTKHFKEKYSNYENCMAAFFSHYTLWKWCAQEGIEYQIFEHDAVAVNDIPLVIPYDKVISLGKPSYGQYNTPTSLGVNQLQSKQYFPGAHAYRLKPEGAKELIERAKIDAGPTDIYLHLGRFPWLEEYYPWPVEARDHFTTIQKEEGCLAKHGYGESYEIVRHQ